MNPNERQQQQEKDDYTRPLPTQIQIIERRKDWKNFFG